MAKKLNEISQMPQMNAAFSGWLNDIVLTVIAQSIGDDGFVSDDSRQITYKGTIQPLSPEQINNKPDGQRSFKWLQIHAFAGTLNLKTNDRIVYSGTSYKVMGIYDYSLNNYIEYHVIEDFRDNE